MNSIINVDNLSFDYGDKEIVKNLSVSINNNEYISIIGHNGSGKSTFARLLVGLLEKKSGSIKIYDQELNEKNIAFIRNKIGMVFQNPDNQFIGSTVKDDIAFGLENRCIDPEKMDTIIDDCLDIVNMRKFKNHEPENLSGGQKQRVAIAGIIAMDLKIVIFDEATSMLDPVGKKNIKKLMKEMQKQNGLTVISITHDMEEASLSDRVLLLNNGKLLKFDKPENVFVDKELLKKCKLKQPFVYYLQDILKNENIGINYDDDIKEVANKICLLK